MGHLQHVPREPGNELTVREAVHTTPYPGELPTGSMKRDYSGMLEYWHMIRRHKGLVALGAVLGLVGGYALTLPEKRIYQSKTTIEIQGMNEDFLNMKNVNPMASSANAYNLDYEIQTQVKIIQSNTMLERVTAKMQTKPRTDITAAPDRLAAWRKVTKLEAPDPVALWKLALGTAAGSVKVKASGTNRIVEVTTDSTDPKVAADFLNILAEEFIEQNLESRWKSTEHTGQWLTNQLQDMKVKLERADDQLQAYARQSGLVFTSETSSVNDDKLKDLQKDFSSALGDRVAKQSKYEMAAASPPDALPDVVDDSNLRDYQKNLTELQREYAKLRTVFKETHPEVKRVVAQITLLDESLKKERGNILQRIRNDYETARRREKMLEESYAKQASLVSDQAAKMTHYNILKREVDTSRQIYEEMLQKLKEASVASALRASNIRVVDPASPSKMPYKPDIFRFMTLGLLTGLVLGVAAVVFIERADRTLQDPGDVAYYLRLPELGVIPSGSMQAPGKRMSGGRRMIAAAENITEKMEIATHSQKTSIVSESFRTALTSILFSGPNGDRPRVMVFTSASPREGKTTVTCNMAIAMAEIKDPVLIIDCDMRKPRLHKVFEVDNRRGLSDLLNERRPLTAEKVQEAVRRSSIPGLHVLPSGGSRANVTTLLHSDRLVELMDICREKYDTVLIDTPPMVNIPDARLVAKHTDALILVLRSSVTTRDAATLALRRFAEDGIPVLGTILNGWNPNTPGYGYYRNYYSGYYHYYGNTNGSEPAAGE